MSGTSKANQRQSTRRKGYYASQKDRTEVNKAVTFGRHVGKHILTDKSALSRLANVPPIILSRAAERAAMAGGIRTKQALLIAGKMAAK